MYDATALSDPKNHGLCNRLDARVNQVAYIRNLLAVKFVEVSNTYDKKGFISLRTMKLILSVDFRDFRIKYSHFWWLLAQGC
jgi:hypothetical protein